MYVAVLRSVRSSGTQVGLIAVNLRIERVGKSEQMKGGDKFETSIENRRRRPICNRARLL